MLPNTGCQAQKVLMEGSVLKPAVIPTTLRSRRDGGTSPLSFVAARITVKPGGRHGCPNTRAFRLCSESIPLPNNHPRQWSHERVAVGKDLNERIHLTEYPTYWVRVRAKQLPSQNSWNCALALLFLPNVSVIFAYFQSEWCSIFWWRSCNKFQHSLVRL